VFVCVCRWGVGGVRWRGEEVTIGFDFLRCMLLGPNYPPVTRLPRLQPPEMSDHDFLQQQRLKLQTISQRTMAISVGRGMFTLSTMHPVITQKVPVPPLDVTGRAVSSGANITMEAALPPDYFTWPMFSNGVAAALRIGPAGTTKLSTTWIAYHKCASVRHRSTTSPPAAVAALIACARECSCHPYTRQVSVLPNRNPALC